MCLHLHVEDPEATGIDDDNDSISGSDATVALGGLDTEGNTDELFPSNQAKLTGLIREINDLHHWVEVGEGQPVERLDCIEWELQNLFVILQTQSPPTPTEPLGGVICQYTDTLCFTQKQTNLTNSLLHDISVFNEYDSTKLEDWLTDIETTADLTNESQAKLAKARLRGLTHTMVRKAINSDKCCEEKKDLLQLKICNTNINTYTSCFMDIKHQGKESLAAYTHRFEIEAKRCKFTNDATTIRIFIKGLKNAHGLARHIYEKELQMLTDTLSEVEMLNATQQLMAMIMPPSMVNVKSNEKDCCFQHQKPGHIAQNCPHIRCYECNEYGLIIMDCPHEILPLETQVTHHKSHKGHHTRLSLRHHCDDRDIQSQTRSHSH